MPGQHQQRLQRPRRDVGEPAREDPRRAGRAGPLERRPPPQRQRQRQHGHDAERADRRCAPGASRRPRSRIAARAARSCRRDSCRSPRPRPRCRGAREPERDVGDQRAEGRRAAEQADQQRLREHELPELGRLRGGDVAEAQHQRAEDHRQHDAEAVGEPAHQHAADREAQHGRGVGQRRAAAARRRTRPRSPAAPPRPTTARCRRSC